MSCSRVRTAIAWCCAPASRSTGRCRITASWIDLREPAQLEPLDVAQQLDEALGLKRRPLLALVSRGDRRIAGGAVRMDVLRDPGMGMQPGRAQELELVLHPHRGRHEVLHFVLAHEV